MRCIGVHYLTATVSLHIIAESALAHTSDRRLKSANPINSLGILEQSSPCQLFASALSGILQTNLSGCIPLRRDVPLDLVAEA